MLVKYCAYSRCRKRFETPNTNWGKKYCSTKCQDLALNKAKYEPDGKGGKFKIKKLANGLEVIDNIVWKAVGHHYDKGAYANFLKPIVSVLSVNIKHKRHAAA